MKFLILFTLMANISWANETVLDCTSHKDNKFIIDKLETRDSNNTQVTHKLTLHGSELLSYLIEVSSFESIANCNGSSDIGNITSCSVNIAYYKGNKKWMTTSNGQGAGIIIYDDFVGKKLEITHRGIGTGIDWYFGHCE